MILDGSLPYNEPVMRLLETEEAKACHQPTQGFVSYAYLRQSNRNGIPSLCTAGLKSEPPLAVEVDVKS
jgi:hypothetical protein